MQPSTAPLHFKGGPTRLQATWEWPQGLPASRVGQVSLAETGPLPLTIRRPGSESAAISILSFRMPKSTKPGSYPGSVTVGEMRIPIIADVEARPQLRFVPAEVALTAIPGGKATTEVDLLNLGNVDVSIEPESTFCVFGYEGVHPALFRALTESSANGKNRLDRFLDELADSHGGLVRARVAGGKVQIAPGELKKLVLELLFSHKMKTGDTYYGAWTVSGSSFGIQVEAIETTAKQ